jgi:hypothetical protein
LNVKTALDPLKLVSNWIARVGQTVSRLTGLECRAEALG